MTPSVLSPDNSLPRAQSHINKSFPKVYLLMTLRQPLRISICIRTKLTSKSFTVQSERQAAKDTVTIWRASIEARRMRARAQMGLELCLSSGMTVASHLQM